MTVKSNISCTPYSNIVYSIVCTIIGNINMYSYLLLRTYAHSIVYQLPTYYSHSLTVTWYIIYIYLPVFLCTCFTRGFILSTMQL